MSPTIQSSLQYDYLLNLHQSSLINSFYDPSSLIIPSNPLSLSAASILQQMQLQPLLAAALVAASKEEKPEGDNIMKPIAVRPSHPLNLSTRNAYSLTHSLPSRNKLGRSYNPGRPLAMQERQRILELYEKGHKISHIARLIGVTHSCVSKIMTRFRRTGSMHPRSMTMNTNKEQSPLHLMVHTQFNLLEEEIEKDKPINTDEDKYIFSPKSDSPICRLSVSPSSAFSVPIRKQSPSYCIESLLHS